MHIFLSPGDLSAYVDESSNGYYSGYYKAAFPGFHLYEYIFLLLLCGCTLLLLDNQGEIHQPKCNPFFCLSSDMMK